MTQVVQTALGLPSKISSADIDDQAKMITSKIELTDFQDPAKVTKFVQRFAAMWDATQAQQRRLDQPGAGPDRRRRTVDRHGYQHAHDTSELKFNR